MGGDGLVDKQFVALGGRAGDLATNVGAPAESLPSAKQFIADYEAANYAEPFGAYGAFTYDATNVVIDGLAKAVQGGTWSEDTRKTVVSNVQATNLQGAGGPLSFDEFGDTTNKVLTVYTVKGDNFEPIEGSTGSYESS
jgi:branched-chain amino acid transport system substrate-binding protein